MTTDALTNAAAAGTQAAQAAAPVVDPNTMLATTPKEITPLPIAKEHESFVDEWAKAPEADAPVRTWVDPTQRDAPGGDYLSAWYDTPVTPTGQPEGDVAAAAAPVAALAPAALATPGGPPAEVQPPGVSDADWQAHLMMGKLFHENPSDGPGEGGGGPGDGSGIGSASSATGNGGEGVGNGVGGSAAGSGVGDGGDNGDSA